MSPPRLGRAAKLLVRLGLSHPDNVLAEALVINDVQLQRYLSGADPIPLEHQLCIAHFVEQHAPALARERRTLIAQIRAQLAFEAGETQRHNGPPKGAQAPPLSFRRTPKYLLQ